MLAKRLQYSLLVVSLLIFIYVVSMVSKKKLNIRYSIVWIIWSLCMIFISIFPKAVMRLTWFMGVEVPANAVFLIMIFLLYCISFYVFLVISKHNNEITTLNYEISNLYKRIKELENKEK